MTRALSRSNPPSKCEGRLRRASARAARAAFSIFLALSCSCAAGMRQVRTDPATASTPPPGSGTMAADAAAGPGLSSRWGGGTCHLRGNTLSYSVDPGRAPRFDILLDSQVRNPERLLCSESFAVIIEPGRAVVAIGGSGAAAGAQMLGRIGGRVLVSNSYEVSLAGPEGEGLLSSSAALTSDVLSFYSADGRRWFLPLSDPFRGWGIY